MRLGRVGPWLLIVLLVAQPVYGAAVTPSKLVSADQRRIVFEVDATGFQVRSSARLEGTSSITIPGFATTAEPGKPALPGRSFWVALPPGARYTVRHRVLETRTMDPRRLEPAPFTGITRDEMITTSAEFRIDPQVYESEVSTVRVLDEGVGKWRHQNVLSVRVLPVAFNPRTGDLQIATRIQVEINITAGGDRFEGRPQTIPDAPAFERMYDALLLNPEQARQWRTRPKRSVPTQSSLSQGVLPGPLVKLKVPETGFYKVTAAKVINKGYPGGVNVASVRLFQRSYDDGSLMPMTVEVPRQIVETGGGQAGVFDGSDYVLFYGQSIRDDALQNDPEAKFTDDNVYWLGTGTGTDIASKTVGVGTVSGDTATASFNARRVYEKDFFFNEEARPGVTDFFTFNAYFLSTAFATTFEMGSAKPGSDMIVRMEVHGHTFPIPGQYDGNRTLDISLRKGGTTVPLTPVSIFSKNIVTYQSAPVSTAQITPGTWTFRVLGSGGFNNTIDAVIDWYEVQYEALYRARGNELVFDSGSSSGASNFSITGLTRNDVMLFNVTDSQQPQVCTLTASHFTPVSGGYVLSFVDNIASVQDYRVLPLDQVPEITSPNIDGDEPSSIIGSVYESGVDVLVVSHASFMGEMQRWVDYRRAQGYRVSMVDVAEVFDEFHGGIPHARAVRRFARHFFQNGNAAYLVLVGDSSEDNKTVHPGESAPNYVPTESFAEFVFGGDFNEDEVVTTDKYLVNFGQDFIENPSDDPNDYLLDMIVGRFPAGSITELRTFLNKTFLYERTTASDTWKNRILHVADDDYVVVGNNICDVNQTQFEQAEDLAAQITEQALGDKPDVVRFFLSDRLAHPSSCIPTFTQISRCRTETVPAHFAELNKGASIVSMSFHMNRNQIAHEVLFSSSSLYRDHLQLQNVGRPFVLYGLGCHLSDYAIHKELNRTGPNGINGDCLSELFMVQANRGAVLTYGSTGFEYLLQNFNYSQTMWEVYHNNPPTDPNLPGGSRQVTWVWGDVMTRAELVNLAAQGAVGSGDGGVGQLKRYHTLGDPLLRIDLGPPKYDVTVDGNTIDNDDFLSVASPGVPVQVEATIIDEGAIADITLEIDNADRTSDLTITPINDASLDVSRRYQVSFEHQVLPKTYDIVLRTFQAPDTTAGAYHMVGEFTMRVRLDAALSVNGRPITDGDIVPPNGDYVFEITSPIPIDPSQVRVEVDTQDIGTVDVTQPEPQDSSRWQVRFTTALTGGAHRISVFVDANEFPFNVVVSDDPGLRDIVAWPNPFVEDTRFVFRNDTAVNGGKIDIYTTTGKKVAHVDIPPLGVGQNAVRWDGRTFSGDTIGNGVYLYVITIEQDGRNSTYRGKIARAE